MYRASQPSVRALFIVLSCIVSRACYSEHDSAFTHEDILTVLRDQEGRIDDLLLEFDSEEAEYTESGVLVGRKRENTMLMAKGSLFRTRRQSFDPETQEVIFDQEFAGDGAVEYFCDRQALYGTIRSRLPEQCVMRQSWASDYLISVMRHPRRKGGFGFEGNLIGALEEAPKGITISEEFADGRKIVVLTRFSSPGVAHSEIRLDPEMNFAVLSKTGIGMHEGDFRFVNSDFVEVMDGVWLPRKVERFKRDKTSHTRRETMRVKTIEFNKGFTKGDFAIRFPYGVRVRDLDTRMHVTPSPKELDEVYLDHLLETAAEQNVIDVYHVDKTSGEDIPDAVVANAHEGNRAATGRSHVSWKMLVTFLMLGSAGVAYILSYSVRHRKKT